MVARAGISADALEGRIATFLHQHQVNAVVDNVRRNNPWESEFRIEELESEVRRTYQACESVVTGKSVYAIARQYALPVHKVRNWHSKDCIPRLLGSHARPLTPSTREERFSFAYLLGVYSKSRSKSSSRSKLGQKPFHAKVSDAAARERVLRNGKVLLSDELQEDGVTVYYPHRAFARILHYCVRNDFESYVLTDPEKVAYLRGFFDASNIKIDEGRRGELYYRISKENKPLLKLLVKVLFELGIFPRVSESDNTFHIESLHDLNQLQQLEVDANTENRAKVASALLRLPPQSHTLKTYFGVRKAVRQRLEQGPIKSWERLATELKSPRETIKRWTADIVRQYDPSFGYETVTPRMVQRYRGLTDFLGIPNLFEEEGSHARIGENFFFNVEGEVYYIPPKVQKSYSRQVKSGVLEDHLELLQDQLRKNLKGNTDVSLKMKVTREGAITSLKTRYVYQDNLQLEVDGQTITLTNQALYNYFAAYGLELAPLTPTDIDFLREQYASNGEGDLTFKMGAEGVVKSISLKQTTKGGNRWDMQRDYTGIDLGRQSSNLLSVFGFVPLRY